MRMTFGLLAVAALTAGCGVENDLRFTSSLQSQTRGVALSDVGLDAYAGMIGSTCTIDTNWGCPTSDTDLPSDEEQVVDHLGGDTLGVSPEGLHIIRGTAWQAELDLGIADVRAAALRTDGPMVVAGDQVACELHLDDGTVALPAEACAADAHYAFDRSRGSVFVSVGGTVHHAAADRNEAIAEAAGDLVDYDAQNELIYVAATGGREVTAMRVNGATLWTTELSGPITSLAARGRLGEVLVMTEAADGFGALERLDGQTGGELGTFGVPSPVCALEVSDNGHTVACVRPEEVNFYELDAGFDGEVIDQTPPENCIDPIDQMTMD